jgi:dimethylaniline monooxygenase (N-oxide forming)
VGAGVAGIATARVLRALGHDVVILESRPDVGGVWSTTRAYAGLGLQSDKRAYAFADRPMPESYPEYPTAAQVRAYLQSYVAEHELDRCLQLGSTVVSATPEGEGWSLMVETPAGRHVETADWLVLCNGLFSRPHVPAWPGREEFEQAGGRVFSPSDLGDGEACRGRKLVVLGWGKSATDIATSSLDAAASVDVVARNIGWKLPRRVGRIPWQRLVLSRAGEFMFFGVRRADTFLRLSLRLLHPFRAGALWRLQRTVARDLELRRRDLTPTKRIEDFDSLITPGFLEAIDQGSITVHRNRAVHRLTSSDGRPCVVLSDGTVLPCDTLVAATGYDRDLSALAPVVRSLLVDRSGELHLYCHTIPAAVPHLAFVGWHASYRTPVTVQVQALWLAAAIHQRVPDPSDRERRRFTSVYRLHGDGADREGAPLFHGVLASTHDLDKWVREAGLVRPRRTRAAEVLRPVDPTSYADLLGQLEERLRVTPESRSPFT